ncbi:hypothetical protein TNCT_253131 [Trichonephila clavata]|uniref:Uncharacterized protein n=1 Tax=Trichonephila clavata TaxID=2740835 RepID=A0A8X6HEY1_TRICU|nr:hypothetical protein TNCT_253131 [Trichonephila clavata]
MGGTPQELIQTKLILELFIDPPTPIHSLVSICLHRALQDPTLIHRFSTPTTRTYIASVAATRAICQTSSARGLHHKRWNWLKPNPFGTEKPLLMNGTVAVVLMQ